MSIYVIKKNYMSIYVIKKKKKMHDETESLGKPKLNKNNNF